MPNSASPAPRGLFPPRPGGRDYLQDLAELHDLKAKYFRYLDTKQWSRWIELFTDDLHYYMDADSPLPSSDVPVTTTSRDFVGLVSAALDRGRSVHHGHTPELSIDGPDLASGIWGLHDYIDVPGRAYHGYGHYHERYVRGGDRRWLIRTLRVTRLCVKYEAGP